jgi:hypothetical protein
MRTVIRFGAQVLVLSTLFAWWLRSTGAEAAVAIRSDVSVEGATRQQIEMVRWAVGRFEAVGLGAPPVGIHFHGDPAGCGGHLGYAKAGRVDMCTTLVNAMARRNLLHEMAHIWLDVNADAVSRARFLEFRGLRAWNASSDPWEVRGYEQGAEIIAWALGERILTPQIPDNGPELMTSAFELLTAAPIPHSG